MRAQRGTTSLRAHALHGRDLRLPAADGQSAQSKTPLLTLLKQARAFGVGCVLATQNPVDLDYKALVERGHVVPRPPADRARQGARARRPRRRGVELGPGLRSAGPGPPAVRTRQARLPAAQRPRRRAGAVSDALDAVVPARTDGARRDPHADGPAARRNRGGHAESGLGPARTGRGAADRGLPVAEATARTRAGRSCRPTCRSISRAARGESWVPMLVGAARIAYSDTKLGVDETSDVGRLDAAHRWPVAADWEHGRARELRRGRTQARAAAAAGATRPCPPLRRRRRATRRGRRTSRPGPPARKAWS